MLSHVHSAKSRNMAHLELAPLHPWAWLMVPWQHIHVDFAGSENGKMLLILVDTHSKWHILSVHNVDLQTFCRLSIRRLAICLHTKH